MMMYRKLGPICDIELGKYQDPQECINSRRETLRNMEASGYFTIWEVLL